MGAERTWLLLLTATALLSVVATGCSATDGRSPKAGAAPQSSTARLAPTADPVERWDSGDPSCIGPARTKWADLPKVLRESESRPLIGARKLWVNPPSLARSTGLRVKYGSVTLDDKGKATDDAGPPKVTAKRVDGAGAGTGSVGGYATEAVDADTTRSFWPTTVDFSTPGCWLITESSGPTTLRFLMRVDA